MKSKLKSILIALLLFSGSIVQTNAKPANNALRTVTQPDGTTITIQMHGDEFFHFTTTGNGEFVTLGEDGYYHYTELNENNQLIAGKQRANNSNPARSAASIDQKAIASRLQEIHAERRNLRLQNIAARKAPMKKAARKAAESSKEVRGIVILAQFQDVKYKSTSTREAFDKLMNEQGNNYLGAIGSARDYFIDQSYGKFQPSFDVVGPVTLDNKMAYYGANDSFYDQDMRPEEMIIDACKKASSQGLCNMADYDLDGDGWVDLVYVIYAGYAESSGAPANTVWPHAWYIYQGAKKTVTVDGVKLDAYACSAELNGTSGSDMDGIGSFCHEYSHTLGLPDFYPTQYTGGFGMGFWSIMDGGCYAEDGRIPLGYMSYERAFCGWLDLTELDAPVTVLLPYIGDNQKAYKIVSDNPDQYFTIETRRQSRWDIGLPAEGLMIVKIDYNQTVWDYNEVNDTPSRQRVQIMPADNSLSEYNMEGDLFPYGKNNSFTSTSKPAMKIYTTTIQNKPITNISYNADQGVTTFDFMGGGTNTDLATPVATSAGDITSNSFVAYWSPVAEATSYTLHVERVTETPQSTVLREDFSLFATPLNKNIAGTTQVATIDSQYTLTPGWSGKYIYNNEGECKMGNSDNGGILSTPAMDLSATGTYSVTFKCRKYRSSDTVGKVTLTMTGTETTTKEIDFAELSADEMKTITFEGSNGTSNSVFSISPNKRIYIDDITISNAGAAAPEEQDIRIIPDITDTQYKVTDVKDGYYQYKVKAVNESGESPYSNAITVNIPVTGSVNAPATETTRIYSSNGSIVIESTVSEKACVYNMQGVAIATMDVDGKATYTPAEKGLYIVRCGNTGTKVVVR